MDCHDGCEGPAEAARLSWWTRANEPLFSYGPQVWLPLAGGGPVKQALAPESWYMKHIIICLISPKNNKKKKEREGERLKRCGVLSSVCRIPSLF